MGENKYRLELLEERYYEERQYLLLLEYPLGYLLPALSDQWEYYNDSDFAKDFFRSTPDAFPTGLSSTELCDRCREIYHTFSINPYELQRTETPCALCRLLSRCVKSQNEHNREEIQLLDRRFGLRICTDPGAQGHSDIHIGLPALPEPGSEIHFALIRAWLRDCDKNDYCHRQSDAEWPTRVIDVRSDKGPDFVRLISDPPKQDHYIALSHRWGKPTSEEKEKISTSFDNLESRKDGFDMKELPRTFQDAIEVTRRLDKRYLWIDAICINQKDTEEWERESKRMETVFEHAYFTIAADSTDDFSKEGFLRPERRLTTQESYVKVDTDLYGPVYICKDIDQFQKDVADGPLSKRAWVLQERALSQRTIHFTANQTYWECGRGIRCETLTRMSSKKMNFLSDPQFPRTLVHVDSQRQIGLFQYLYKTYTSLELTEHTDRRVAISGLEQRLAKTFKAPCRYGVFGRFLHRSLLWERSEAVRMRRIDWRVPSWSWMAYDGQIDYMKIEFDQVEWALAVELDDESDGNVLKGEVGGFQACKIEQKDGETRVIGDETSNGEEGWLKFDGPDSTDVGALRCVILGREARKSGDERKYYVLVVAPVCLRGCRTYQRVGIGSVPQRFILFESGEVDGRVL